MALFGESTGNSIVHVITCLGGGGEVILGDDKLIHKKVVRFSLAHLMHGYHFSLKRIDLPGGSCIASLQDQRC